MIRSILGASRCDNKFYHIASPLRRQNLRFCLYVPRCYKSYINDICFNFIIFQGKNLGYTSKVKKLLRCFVFLSAQEAN